MSPAHQSTSLPPELGIPESDWQRTPTTVQGEFLSLLKRVDALESRLHRDSSNSSRPPSTDSAAKKRERRQEARAPQARCEAWPSRSSTDLIGADVDHLAVSRALRL
jgi:hypothetical protein